MVQPVEARPHEQALAHPAEAHVDIGVRPALDQAADHQDQHVVVGLDADELREHASARVISRSSTMWLRSSLQTVTGAGCGAGCAAPTTRRSVLGAMHPVGGEVVEREIDQERARARCRAARHQPFEPGRREAQHAHQMLDLVGDRIGEHEDQQRDDAELVQHACRRGRRRPARRRRVSSASGARRSACRARSPGSARRPA